MRFEVDQELAGTPGEVLGALTEASWYEAVSASPSDWAPRLEAVEEHDGLVVAVVRYRFRGQLNKAARAVLDPERLVHVDRVTIDLARGTFSVAVTPEHQADRLGVSAAGQVTAGAGGARRALSGEVKVRYPIVGGQVERAIVAGLIDHAEHERVAFGFWNANGSH